MRFERLFRFLGLDGTKSTATVAAENRKGSGITLVGARNVGVLGIEVFAPGKGEAPTIISTN